MIFDKINTIIGIIKLSIYKLFYFRRIKIEGLLKNKKDLNILIDKNSTICIGKNVKIRYKCSLISERGGKLCIGDNVFINDGCSINCLKKIKIGDNSSLGHNVLLIDHDHDYKNDFKKFVCSEINIGKNVWIGANVTILKGVTIGDNSIIAAGSLVIHDVPSNTLIYNKINEIEKEIIMKKI